MKQISRIARFTMLILPLGIFSCGGSDDDLKSLQGPWEFRSDPEGEGMRNQWATSDSLTWTTIPVPSAWEEVPEFADLDGIGWYRTTFDLPESFEPVSVLFEGVDDDARVWLNGTEIGSHIGYGDPFVVDAGPVARVGVNSLVVRVVDHSGPGGIYKPVRLIPTHLRDSFLRSPYADLVARKSETWVHSAVIYEVYLRSFSKEGTFSALESRLAELKDLGVTVLWLMPIHPVGELNRKGTLGSPYAIRDFYKVNEEFGSTEDFQSLVRSAHQHGMKIIIDLVANHTAWDNTMLLEHPEWFTTNEDGAIVAPNPDWTDVADLNYDRHELRKYMLSMMRHWVETYDIDGFRCDVSELVPTEFWETARRELEKVKPIMMLSEGTLPEHHVSAFDLTYAWTTYDILDPIIAGRSPASLVSETIQRESSRFPKGSLRLRFNTNHDKNAWDAPAVKKFGQEGALVTAALAFTLPGVPLIYNGEEAGNVRRLDLFEKVDIDWSKGKEYRELYRQLAGMRREHPWLSTGTYRPLAHNGGSSVLAFARQEEGGEGMIFAIFNFGDKPVRCSVGEARDQEGTWTRIVGGQMIISPRDVQLKGRSFVIAMHQQ